MLNEACRNHAGHALPLFIEWLAARRETLSHEVEELTNEFMSHVRSEDDSLAAESIARAMAVVYAGGALGIKARIFPWSSARLKRAVRFCYQGAVRQLSDDAATTERGLEECSGRGQDGECCTLAQAPGR